MLVEILSIAAALCVILGVASAAKWREKRRRKDAEERYRLSSSDAENCRRAYNVVKTRLSKANLENYELLDTISDMRDEIAQYEDCEDCEYCDDCEECDDECRAEEKIDRLAGQIHFLFSVLPSWDSDSVDEKLDGIRDDLDCLSKQLDTNSVDISDLEQNILVVGENSLENYYDLRKRFEQVNTRIDGISHVHNKNFESMTKYMDGVNSWANKFEHGLTNQVAGLRGAIINKLGTIESNSEYYLERILERISELGNDVEEVDCKKIAVWTDDGMLASIGAVPAEENHKSKDDTDEHQAVIITESKNSSKLPVFQEGDLVRVTNEPILPVRTITWADEMDLFKGKVLEVQRVINHKGFPLHTLEHNGQQWNFAPEWLEKAQTHEEYEDERMKQDILKFIEDRMKKPF